MHGGVRLQGLLLCYKQVIVQAIPEVQVVAAADGSTVGGSATNPSCLSACGRVEVALPQENRPGPGFAATGENFEHRR